MSRKFLIPFSFVILVSCQAPSSREIHTFEDVICVEPPADVMASEARAELELSIPRIRGILKAQASIEQKYERIRAEIVNLQAVEVLHFRLCVDYASGALDKVTYREFVESILPLLKEQSTKIEVEP